MNLSKPMFHESNKNLTGILALVGMFVVIGSAMIGLIMVFKWLTS